MYDIIVIGGGPAGLCSALYASRAGKKVLVLEGKAVGGQIINALKVKNYPGIPEISGAELANNMKEQALQAGGEIKYEQVIKVALKGHEKAVETDMGTYTANAIIIATGAENRKLRLPREEELVGRGISYCATCDGNFYKDKDVAVIGGGNTAVEDAIYLSSLANQVYLIHRRDQFRADATNVDKAKACKNVEFILKANAIEFLGDQKIEGLKIKFDDASERELSVDGVFLAIGHVPASALFSGIVKIDDKGYIETNDGVHTSCPGIYVAGDARAKDLKQLVTAVSDGAIAASTAVKELEVNK